jgi:hypothetical protein
LRRYNIGISLAACACAGVLFYATKDFAPVYSNAPGAGFWPRILAGLLVFMAAFLLAETLFFSKGRAENAAPFDFKSPAMKRVYCMLMIFVVFCLLLYAAGFFAACLLFIPAVMRLMGERSVKRMFLVSVCFTGGIYIFFTLLLRISLPLPFFM